MNFSGSGAGYGGEEKFNVTATVDLGNLKLEKKLASAVELIANSLDRLTRMLERLEKPICTLIYASGVSLFLFTTFHIIDSFRSKDKK